MKLRQLAISLTTLIALSSGAHAAQLKLDVVNPGDKSIFPVSSEIISGDKEIVLIDAQFQKNDAGELVKRLKALNKKLTTIYISHSDPDYYFGLETLKAAFPDAKIVATQATVDKIKASKDGKLTYWGGILKEQAPKNIIVPTVLSGDTLTVDGEKLIIKGLTSPTPDRTFVWIPQLKAVVGGVLVSENIHVWLADTQTVESRKHWQQSLESIKALSPKIVVPGHFTRKSNYDLKSVSFTQRYLSDAEKTLGKTENSSQFITLMKKKYPTLDDVSSLELSAKVLKNEMKWPQ